MPFIESAVTQAQEAEVIPEGHYDLRIHSTKDRHNEEKGTDSIEVMILVESVDHPNAQPLNFYLPLVGVNDEPKTKQFKLLQQRRFLEAFGIPYNETGFDTDDFAGASANLPVTQGEVTPKDTSKPKYMKNEIVLPRLAAEDKATAPTTRRRR